MKNWTIEWEGDSFEAFFREQPSEEVEQRKIALQSFGAGIKRDVSRLRGKFAHYLWREKTNAHIKRELPKLSGNRYVDSDLYCEEDQLLKKEIRNNEKRKDRFLSEIEALLDKISAQCQEKGLQMVSFKMWGDGKNLKIQAISLAEDE